MNTDVTLQPPLTFSWWVLAIGIVLVLLAIALPVLVRIIRTRTLAANPPVMTRVRMAAPADPESLRARYLAKLADVEADVKNGRASVKEAYQALSALLRNFIYDVGGPDMRNSTLSDIAVVNMPVIYALVRDYYEPEFALKTEADVFSSINATREVISSWH